MALVIGGEGGGERKTRKRRWRWGRRRRIIIIIMWVFIDKDRPCTNKFIRIIILYHRKSKYDKVTNKIKLNKCMGRKKRFTTSSFSVCMFLFVTLVFAVDVY